MFSIWFLHVPTSAHLVIYYIPNFFLKVLGWRGVGERKEGRGGGAGGGGRGGGELMLSINYQTFFFFLSGLPIYLSAPKTLHNRTMICHHSND